MVPPLGIGGVPLDETAFRSHEHLDSTVDRGDKYLNLGSLGVHAPFPFVYSSCKDAAGTYRVTIKPIEVSTAVWQTLSTGRNGSYSSRVDYSNAVRKDLGMRTAKDEVELKELNKQDLLLWLERKAAAPAPAMLTQLEAMVIDHGGGTMRVETSHPNARLPEQRASGGTTCGQLNTPLYRPTAGLLSAREYVCSTSPVLWDW